MEADLLHPRAVGPWHHRKWHPVRVEVPTMRQVDIPLQRRDAVLPVVDTLVDWEVVPQVRVLRLVCP